jgi:hypothetical protein
MRLFVCSLSALILAVYGGLVSAEDAYDAYPRTLYQAPQFAPISPQSSTRYRWRPLDEENAGAQAERRGPPTNRMPAVEDYTDEPFGLPPGTYRPIEQRHTITPHLEGYRFRPIVPEEQVRNRTQNERQEQSLSDRNYPQSAGQGEPAYEGYPMGGQVPSYNFRPDPRLDKPTRGAPSRYAFPMGSEAPRFRSQ